VESVISERILRIFQHMTTSLTLQADELNSLQFRPDGGQS
jgi:hypothetical protein